MYEDLKMSDSNLWSHDSDKECEVMTTGPQNKNQSRHRLPFTWNGKIIVFTAKETTWDPSENM